MADPRICSVEGCDKAVAGRSLCSMHYARWQRHGNPLAGRTPNGEAAQYYSTVVREYGGDECLEWPYQRDRRGYGRLDVGGRNRLVSNMLCREARGEPPTPEHQAAHSCGNGHLGCVTKRRLDWKTSKENHDDMVAHGRSTRGDKSASAKLSHEQVDEIRSLKGKMSQQAISDMYGVCRSNVGYIHQGHSWKE